MFDIATRQWFYQSTKPFLHPFEEGVSPNAPPLYEHPSARFAHACAHLGEWVYMAGGTDTKTSFCDFWSLHLPTMAWTRHTTAIMPRQLYFHAAAVSPNGVLSIFGGTTAERSHNKNIYQIMVVHRVPRLHTLARNALIELLKVEIPNISARAGKRPKTRSGREPPPRKPLEYVTLPQATRHLSGKLHMFQFDDNMERYS